jgi:putative ABC transport system permease protein
MAGVTAVILLTVLGQVLKAASGNPAEVVKSE